MEAVTTDGTVIEVDRLRLKRSGVALERTRSERSDQSKRSNRSDEQNQGSKQSGNGDTDQSNDVTIVVDEDVPAEEREELVREIDVEEGSRRENQRQSGSSGSASSVGGQSSSQQKGEQSASSGQYATIGFVPFERLRYVSPGNLVTSAA